MIDPPRLVPKVDQYVLIDVVDAVITRARLLDDDADHWEKIVPSPLAESRIHVLKVKSPVPREKPDATGEVMKSPEPSNSPEAPPNLNCAVSICALPAGVHVRPVSSVNVVL